MKKKALSREDRKRQIMLAFAMQIQDRRSGELTVAGIAELLHLSASTKLRDMVTELVIEGLLDYRTEEIPGVAKIRRIYSPNPDNFKRPTPKYQREGRPIKITSKQGTFLTLMDA